MNVSVHSKTIEVTTAMRKYIRGQLKKLKKLSQPVSEVRVFLDNIVTPSGKTQQSDVKIAIGVPGKDVFVRARAKNCYNAITRAMDDAVRHLRKRKEHLLDKKRGKVVSSLA